MSHILVSSLLLLLPSFIPFPQPRHQLRQCGAIHAKPSLSHFSVFAWALVASATVEGEMIDVDVDQLTV